MIARAQFLALVLIGAGIGVAYGLIVLAPGSRAPDQPPLLGKLDGFAPAPRPVTPVIAVREENSADAHADDEEPLVAQSQTSPDATTNDEAPPDHDSDNASDDGPLVPSRARRHEVFDDDITLVPRGPGRFAILDLSPIHRSRLDVRAGKLERDGGGVWANFAHARKVAALRGRKVRVELLHLGFDRDGVPTIAHIRTVDARKVEGVVSLRRGTNVVRVRPDRGETTSEEPF